MLHSASCECIKSHYVGVVLEHEDVRVSDELAFPRPLLKPVIDFFRTTGETAEIVLVCELVERWAQNGHKFERSISRRTASNSRSRASSVGIG